MKNLNTGFYKDLDTNFQEACEMSEKDFSHNELIELLKNGNIPQKQIAALKLDCINNANDAKLLMDNLTGCDGKIREAVALKINNLLRKDKELASFFNQPLTFANATIDINANICRLVVETVEILIQDRNFAKRDFLSYGNISSVLPILFTGSCLIPGILSNTHESFWIIYPFSCSKSVLSGSLQRFSI